jgi:CRP/FNR family transcriptional regulator, cyclic AMP receptor protein
MMQELSALDIRRFPVFSDLTHEEAIGTAAVGHRRLCAAGDTVFRQGDPSDSVFLLVGGRVDVVGTTEEGRATTLATLEPGAVLGEMGLLRRAARGATVVARDNVELWEISRDAFESGVARGERWARIFLLDMAEKLANRLAEVDRQVLDLIDEINRQGETDPRTAELERLRTRLFSDWSF